MKSPKGGRIVVAGTVQYQHFIATICASPTIHHCHGLCREFVGAGGSVFDRLCVKNERAFH